MNYIALTIGPIFQTIRNVRHTREVWAASFLFSYIAKGIIIRVCKSDFANNSYEDINFEADIKPKVKDFVMPNIESNKLFSKQVGVGLFPDRIIFKSSLLGGKNFQKDIIDKVLGDIAKEASLDFPYLKKYLRIDWNEFEVNEDKNPILEISKYLDTFEQQPQLVTETTQNPLPAFFKGVNKNGFLESHYNIPDVNGAVRFESLSEISTRALQGNDRFDIKEYQKMVNAYLWDEIKGDKDDKDFIKALQDKFKEDEKKTFRNYHKYICVVKADGDRIGKTLENLVVATNETINDKIYQFSKKLLDWGLCVKDKIYAYGGVPIYIGGDDLLFFAPVANGQKHIFNLIEDIDTVFANQAWKQLGDVNPSLSYGLSISYYKFPLSEAIEEAESLLYQAKTIRNAIALRFLKHSGSELSFLLEKSNETEKFYKKHFEKIIEQISKIGNDLAFVNAVGYKIRDNQTLIGQIVNSPKRLENLFREVFDENQTAPKSKDKYLEQIRLLIPVMYSICQKRVEMDRYINDSDKATETLTKTIQEIFSLIRIIKFIKGFDELKD